MNLPSVYSFNDYRHYLNAFYRSRKIENSSYSYRQFSIDGGMKSPNLLKLVCVGATNLSTASILRFARALSLKGDEIRYFEALVLENQATDLEEKTYYRERRAQFTRKEKAPSVKISARSSP